MFEREWEFWLIKTKHLFLTVVWVQKTVKKYMENCVEITVLQRFELANQRTTSSQGYQRLNL